MNQNEISYYELMEFLCAVIEHLDTYDGAIVNIPKNITPHVKKSFTIPLVK